MSMQVLVVGAAGQLGAEIVRACSGAGHAVTAVTRRELDVTKHADVLALVAAARPDAIVNCTATTTWTGRVGLIHYCGRKHQDDQHRLETQIHCAFDAEYTRPDR